MQEMDESRMHYESERSQTQNNIYCITPFLRCFEKD